MCVLPKEVKLCFWDVDPAVLDVRRDSHFIVARILEWGDRAAARRMATNYSKARVSRVLRTARDLSERSARFWCVILDIPVKEVRCLNRRSLQTRRRYWPY